MLSRRALVGKIAAGAAAACAVGLARTGVATTTAGEPANVNGRDSGNATEHTEAKMPNPPVPAPWDLVRPLTAGSLVAHGWRVADLSAVVDGSCVLTLRNASDRSYRVHVCRNDGRPQGLVYTENFDLVVMNGGKGDLPTEEGFAQAVAELGHVLAANEAHEAPAEIAALMPHEERLRRFANPIDARLR